MKEDNPKHIMKLHPEVLKLYIDNAARMTYGDNDTEEMFLPYIMKTYDEDRYEMILLNDYKGEFMEYIYKMLPEHKSIALLTKLVDVIKQNSGMYGDVESVVDECDEFLMSRKWA